MKYLVTGAGQIGTQLILDLLAEGHQVNVLRTSPKPVGKATIYRGDVQDKALLAEAAQGCAAIFHCTHAPYDSRQWAALLPTTEKIILDLAAELGIPACFPESVYAFAGHEEIAEGATYAPIESKGEVRVQLLEQRKAHDARAISVVAADLYGPTATSEGSVLKATVLDPMAKNRPIIVPANPQARHSFTFIPDLTKAMKALVEDADKQGVYHAPTAPVVPLQEWAAGKRMWSVPQQVLKAAGRVNRTMYELAEISPIWYRDSVLVSS